MSTNSISPIRQRKKIISAIKTLFVFNPEHDLALAVGTGPYTPPTEVVKLRKKLSLLPLVYAGNSDFILLSPEVSKEEAESLDFFPIVKEKNITLIPSNELSSFSSQIERVVPWGWDHAIRRQLVDNGISPDILPDASDIDKIRELSHRRTTIPFRQTIAEFLGEDVLNLPQELFSTDEVESFLNDNPFSYFKAPWSSSGRGIVVSDHISHKGLMEWAHGILRRQGSIIAEPSWNRVFDFATEWFISKGIPEFLGFSVFQTSSRGKYHGNIMASQDDLLKLIKEKNPSFGIEIINSQRHALLTHIAPCYEGPLGIDMLGDSFGNINPCVEINLRMTMGHLSILSKKL